MVNIKKAFNFTTKKKPIIVERKKKSRLKEKEEVESKVNRDRRLRLENADHWAKFSTSSSELLRNLAKTSDLIITRLKSNKNYVTITKDRKLLNAKGIEEYNKLFAIEKRKTEMKIKKEEIRIFGHEIKKEIKREE